VLLFEGEGVAEGDPGLGLGAGDIEELLGKEREEEGRRSVPEEGGEGVHVEEGIGVEEAGLEEGSFGLKGHERKQRRKHQCGFISYGEKRI
jgi:hypothetical protein